MDPLSVYVVAVLLAVPGANGNLVFKDVTTEHVEVTLVVPGTDIRVEVDALLHNTMLVFSTREEMTFRVVALLMFHGDLSITGTLPMVGPLDLKVSSAVAYMRFVGTVEVDLLDPFNATLDGLAAARFLGALEISFGGVTFSQELNSLVLVKFADGQIQFIRLVARDQAPMPAP